MSTVLAQRQVVLRALSDLSGDRLPGGLPDYNPESGIPKWLSGPALERWRAAIQLRCLCFLKLRMLTAFADYVKSFSFECLYNADADRFCNDLETFCGDLYDLERKWRLTRLNEVWIFRRIYRQFPEVRESLEDTLEGWLLSKDSAFRELLDRFVSELRETRNVHESENSIPH